VVVKGKPIILQDVREKKNKWSGILGGEKKLRKSLTSRKTSP